jgi:hypothetical protein
MSVLCAKEKRVSSEGKRVGWVGMTTATGWDVRVRVPAPYSARASSPKVMNPNVRTTTGPTEVERCMVVAG